MGQAKAKRRTAFPDSLVNEWEAEDCVNFAVALARLTGWLLHVDWWSPGTDPEHELPLDRLKPLRVYVADNHDKIFDVRGVRRIQEFTERTIAPLARRHGTGGVRTRFYSEAVLATLPLRSQPDEVKIARASEAIRGNHAYLTAVPRRPPEGLPAHEAARFTYGMCVPFAEALSEVTEGEPVALLAVRFSPLFEGTRRGATGFFHSVVLGNDGLAEDSWGKASIKEIAERFGVLELRVSREEHQVVSDRLRQNSPERFEAALSSARALLHAHRAVPSVGHAKAAEGGNCEQG